MPKGSKKPRRPYQPVNDNQNSTLTTEIPANTPSPLPETTSTPDLTQLLTIELKSHQIERSDHDLIQQIESATKKSSNRHTLVDLLTYTADLTIPDQDESILPFINLCLADTITVIICSQQKLRLLDTHFNGDAIKNLINGMEQSIEKLKSLLPEHLTPNDTFQLDNLQYIVRSCQTHKDFLLILSDKPEKFSSFHPQITGYIRDIIDKTEENLLNFDHDLRETLKKNIVIITQYLTQLGRISSLWQKFTYPIFHAIAHIIVPIENLKKEFNIK